MADEHAAYVVYVDEAGDPGIKQKSQSDLAKSSEWFVLSATVVASVRDRDVVTWVDDMREAVRAQQRAPLHFRRLSKPNQERVCRMLSSKDVRLFTVASHKTNMRGYQNKRMGTNLGRGEFYNWCLRLLFERVSQWCEHRSKLNGSPVQSARTIFSQRGGHDYDHLRNYISLLNAQSLEKRSFLPAGRFVPGVIVPELCEVRAHDTRAGLQLADITASAFFQSADSLSPTYSIECAKLLHARTAKAPGKRTAAGFGLMMLPFRHQGEIPVADRPLFEMFGYGWR